MTSILTASIGSYPRVGEEKDQQRYRRGYRHFENREISAHGFRDVVQSVVQEVLREQIMSGVDEVTDGLISWHDPISHLVRNIPGFKLTSLARYFDNNFYVRQPTITSKPKFKDAVIAPEISYAQSQSHKPVRAVLTGPYTLARFTLSSNKAFEKLPARISLYTDLLLMEIEALAKLTSRTIQIDEPALSYFPEDMPLVKKSLQMLASATAPNKSVLALHFSSPVSLVDTLKDLPFGAFNLDFTREPSLLMERLVKAGITHVELGLLDARSTKMEPMDHLHQWVKHWIQSAQPAQCVLSPAGGLEFLPRDAALIKLRLLSKIKSDFRG